jgi:hypothetical protein
VAAERRGLGSGIHFGTYNEITGVDTHLFNTTDNEFRLRRQARCAGEKKEDTGQEIRKDLHYSMQIHIYAFSQQFMLFRNSVNLQTN